MGAQYGTDADYIEGGFSIGSMVETGDEPAYIDGERNLAHPDCICESSYHNPDCDVHPTATAN